ncbi:hypothetical protein P7C70_g4288, partial [Phenoliferia sp. Uapishka_3]
MVATFHSLPPELVFQILDSTSGDVVSRRRSLLSHSLVALAWVDPCQHLLWKEIEVRSRESIHRLLASGQVGKHRSQVLRVINELMPAKVTGSGREKEIIDGELLESLLRGLRGLRGLVVEEVEGLALSNFRVPALADLEHLHIDMAFDKVPAIPVQNDVNFDPLPFRLHSLTLSGYDDLAPFIPFILHSSTKISELRLAFEASGPTNLAIANAFPQIATSVRHLSVGFATAAWIPLLHYCTNLSSISAQWDDLELKIAVQDFRHLAFWHNILVQTLSELKKVISRSPPQVTSTPAIPIQHTISPRSAVEAPVQAESPTPSSPPNLDPSSPNPSEPSVPSEPSTPVNHVHHSNVIPAYPYNVSMVPQGHNGQTPDDLGITTRLPSICVDYLSHDWAEDDVWTSWKAMTRHKSEIANGVRLENASWRTWAKQRGNLKTISPETLNWLKDSDVTWLYGPLHTAVDAVPPPRVATASERLGLEPLRSLSDARAEKEKNAKLAAAGKKPVKQRPVIVTKPILKYRSLSDILLPPGTPASPVLESIDELDHIGANLPQARSDSALWRMNSVGRTRAPSQSPRGGSPDRGVTSDSSNSTTSASRNGGEKRHISFNHRVEQCIAVDSTEEAKKYPSTQSSSSDGSDEDDGDDEDDFLTLRSSPRIANFGPDVMSTAHHRSRSSSASDREPHTIARLGPTTLKSTEMWPAPSPAVVYQNQLPPSARVQSKSAAAAIAGVEAVAAYAQPVATYTTRPTTQATGGRKTMYDYSNAGSSGGMASQWDPDDDEDYAMGFDYHLVGTSHNNYQGGTTASPYLNSSSPTSTAATPSSYNPYAPSPSTSGTASTESSPNHSRRSSNNPSVSSSPTSAPSPAAPLRGPHAPVAASKDAPNPKRSIMKGGGPSRSRENSATIDDSITSSSPTSSQVGRYGSASSTSPITPPGSGATSPTIVSASPQVRPIVRRAGSEEFRDRDREGRGRSASRGSTSSLERSASADRRSSLSPASSYTSLVGAAAASSASGSRPIGIPGSRRSSSDALNTLAGGMPGSRLMPDLPEASSESEAETSKPASVEIDTVKVPTPHVTAEPDSPIIATQTLEEAVLPSMDGAQVVTGKANSRTPPMPSPSVSSSANVEAVRTPPLVASPSASKPAASEPVINSVITPTTPAPRYRQPSPAKPASSTTTEEDAHAVDLQSLSNSPALDPADLAAAPWSDESGSPSYARRSLLRAARGGSEVREDGTRASVDSARHLQTDDYGFGYYDEDAETGLVGRGLDVAGTARDIIGALSRGLCAKIFACDLVVSGLDKQFSKEIKNGTLATCALDVTDWKASRRSFESAVQTFGSLDNVILNAGMLEPKSFWGDQDEAPYLPMEVNASATFRGTRLAVRSTSTFVTALWQDSEGLIIITGSVMGQIPGPKTPLYCASKWAVEGFVRSLAFLHKAANVRVVVLEPGVIKTSFWEQIGVDQHTLPNAGTSSVATVVEAWEDIIHDPVGIPGGSAYEVSGSATRLYTLDSPRCKDESPLDGKGLLELIKAAARKV